MGAATVQNRPKLSQRERRLFKTNASIQNTLSRTCNHAKPSITTAVGAATIQNHRETSKPHQQEPYRCETIQNPCSGKCNHLKLPQSFKTVPMRAIAMQDCPKPSQWAPRPFETTIRVQSTPMVTITHAKPSKVLRRSFGRPRPINLASARPTQLSSTRQASMCELPTVGSLSGRKNDVISLRA